MKKKVIKGVAIIFVIVIIYCVLWLIITKVKYDPYINAIPYSEKHGDHIYRDEDDYVYSAYSPTPYFLSFSGNLAISRVVAFDTEGRRLAPDGTYPYIGKDIELIAWPQIFGGYKIFVSIIEYTGEYDANGEPITNAVEYLLDENKKSIENLSEEEKTTLQNHQNDIDFIFNKMNDMWGISQ